MLLALLLAEICHRGANNAVQVRGHILVDLVSAQGSGIDSLRTGKAKPSRGPKVGLRPSLSLIVALTGHRIVALRASKSAHNPGSRGLIVRLRGLKSVLVLAVSAALKVLRLLRSSSHGLISALRTSHASL